MMMHKRERRKQLHEAMHKAIHELGGDSPLDVPTQDLERDLKILREIWPSIIHVEGSLPGLTLRGYTFLCQDFPKWIIYLKENEE